MSEPTFMPVGPPGQSGPGGGASVRYSRGGCAALFTLAVALLTAGCSKPTSSEDAGRYEGTGEQVQETGEASGAVPFTGVTEQAGLGAFRHRNGGFGEKWFPEIMGAGGGFVDYDGDGWLDIVLVGGGSLPGRPRTEAPALWLYRNEGDGTFANVTAQVGLGDVRAYGFGITAADYDNDGDEDLLLTTLEENMLFQNEGGTFREVGREAGLAEDARWSTSALFFDPDRDGDLDIYAANYVEWTPDTVVRCTNEGVRDYCNPRRYRGAPDAYYRNEGDGTFTERTSQAGFLANADPEAGARGLGASTLDFNRDGWPDLYVANDGERNFLYRNDGDGTFTETALRSGVALDRRGTPRAGMGVDVGVVDSTGEPTVFVGNFTDEMVGVWRHDGGGLFTNRAAPSRIGFPTRTTLTFGLVLFDADLDTDLDLLLANGHVLEQIGAMQEGLTLEEPPQLFLNRGDGVFDEAARGDGPLARPMLARGLAFGDVDRDGDLDVLFTENNGPAHLWRNDLAEAHFLRVHLRGTVSNRDGVGARIRARVGGLTMERRVRAGGSYLSQVEKTATFGLATRRNVAWVEVRWPSGQVERFEQVVPDQSVVLVEGAGELVPQALNQASARR